MLREMAAAAAFTNERNGHIVPIHIHHHYAVYSSDGSGAGNKLHRRWRATGTNVVTRCPEIFFLHRLKIEAVNIFGIHLKRIIRNF